MASVPADELEDVRVAIAALRTALEDDHQQLSVAREKAFALSRRMAEARAARDAVEQRLETKAARLATLQTEQRQIDEALESAQGLLAHNLVARQILTGQSRLKLLLNINDTSKLARTVAYHDYVARAYTARHETLSRQQTERRAILSALKLETNAVRRLRQEHADQVAALDAMHAPHAAIIELIESRMADDAARLAQLEADEQQLLALVEELTESTAPNATTLDFGSLKGQLAWPVAGRVAKAPGKAIREGGARWAGVVIDATPGDQVRAIAAGEVVYADWFRNLGRLVIIDHGEGYMSLYGNTEQILIEPGVSVAGGDTIASVGASQGDGAQGLYFEIRSNGDPMDPRSWCASR